MKNLYLILLMVATIALGALLVSGCGLIPGFSTADAQAIAEKREAELQSTIDRVNELEAAMVEAREAYEAAQRSGDEKAILEAGQVLIARIGAMELGKDDLNNARSAAQSALQDLKDANSTADYLEFFLGSLGGILGAFGIGVPGVRRMTASRDEALAVTAANVKSVMGDKDMELFKARQRELLSREAKSALDRARDK